MYNLSFITFPGIFEAGNVLKQTAQLNQIRQHVFQNKSTVLNHNPF
jgi:hypothetical protein